MKPDARKIIEIKFQNKPIKVQKKIFCIKKLFTSELFEILS